jgi:hypothetical protein
MAARVLRRRARRHRCRERIDAPTPGAAVSFPRGAADAKPPLATRSLLLGCGYCSASAAVVAVTACVIQRPRVAKSAHGSIREVP